jgi:hypothetical protein
VTEQPDENTIAGLLEDLQSSEGPRRKSAAELIARKRIDDPQLVSELERLSAHDPLVYVRDAAEQALKRLRPVPGSGQSREEKLRHLAIGFFGWYVINGMIWFILLGGSSAGGDYGYFNGLFTFPANILVLIILAAIKSTRQIALGILAALALNLLIALVLGVSTNGICFIPFYIR